VPSSPRPRCPRQPVKLDFGVVVPLLGVSHGTLALSPRTPSPDPDPVRRMQAHVLLAMEVECSSSLTSP